MVRKVSSETTARDSARPRKSRSGASGTGSPRSGAARTDNPKPAGTGKAAGRKAGAGKVAVEPLRIEGTRSRTSHLTRTAPTRRPTRRPMTDSPYIEVRTSKIHNRGVFARIPIPEGARVIEYVGERVTKAEGQRRAEVAIEAAEKDHSKGFVYVFELNKRYDIDGDVDWNTAKWINHSCEPNCEAVTVRGHIWIMALRDIEPGEELSYNYGYDIDVCDDHPCLCGSEDCVGFIVAAEFHDQILERQAARMLEE